MHHNREKINAAEKLLCDGFDSQNPSIITAILTLDGNFSAEWVEKNIASAILKHPRFRSIIDKDLAHFKTVSDFELGYHITYLRSSLNEAALHELLSTPLNRNRPTGIFISSLCQKKSIQRLCFASTTLSVME